MLASDVVTWRGTARKGRQATGAIGSGRLGLWPTDLFSCCVFFPLCRHDSSPGTVVGPGFCCLSVPTVSQLVWEPCPRLPISPAFSLS